MNLVKLNNPRPVEQANVWLDYAWADPENDDAWIPAFFLDDFERLMFEMAGLLFYATSSLDDIDGKPFVSINAIVKDRPNLGFEGLRGHILSHHRQSA